MVTVGGTTTTNDDGTNTLIIPLELYNAFAKYCFTLVRDQKPLPRPVVSSSSTVSLDSSGLLPPVPSSSSTGTNNNNLKSAKTLITNTIMASTGTLLCTSIPPNMTYDTALIIYQQQYTKWIRKNAKKHRQTTALERYIHLYTQQKLSIIYIAKQINYSPYLLARNLLPYLFTPSTPASTVTTATITKSNISSSSSSSSLSSSISSSLSTNSSSIINANTALNPHQLPLVPTIPKNMITHYIRNPHHITDERLRNDIITCCANDEHFSPFFDRIHNYLGIEYEYKLQQYLTIKNIPYNTEQDLRKLGYPRTPDAHLKRPIVIPCPYGNLSCSSPFLTLSSSSSSSSSTHEHIICWIDSKASFGDPFHHGEENASQLRSYVQFYGPGLVIYWYGFVDTLCTCLASSSSLYPSKSSVSYLASVSASSVRGKGSSSSLVTPIVPSSTDAINSGKGLSLITHPEPRILLTTHFPLTFRYITDAEWKIIQATLPTPQSLKLTSSFNGKSIKRSGNDNDNEENDDEDEVDEEEMDDDNEDIEEDIAIATDNTDETSMNTSTKNNYDDNVALSDGNHTYNRNNENSNGMHPDEDDSRNVPNTNIATTNPTIVTEHGILIPNTAHISGTLSGTAEGLRYTPSLHSCLIHNTMVKRQKLDS